jgi:antitoxin ParD1/3/4
MDMVSRANINVMITPEHERFIEDRVASGRYPTASEVIQEGLRLLEEKEDSRDAAIQEIRNKIATGIEQANQGEMLDGEAVFRELAQLSQDRRSAR